MPDFKTGDDSLDIVLSITIMICCLIAYIIILFITVSLYLLACIDKIVGLILLGNNLPISLQISRSYQGLQPLIDVINLIV